MWENLEKIFLEMGIDYARQGSFSKDDEIPQSIFTFWNYDTPESGFYDNTSHKAIWVWQIYFYTTDPSLIYSKMQEFITLAKREGFIVSDKGVDIASDKPNYLGRTTTISFIENYE